ncbi:MAG: hypothetical protein D3926_22255 [Desulfobacteraceae bacterium]|nr:MAG: hypothetical protein D3926_22255 [Desulfobacteraceae bacterium]
MKITDPEIIKTGEKDLIDAVKDDLDWDALKDILKDKISQAVLESKDGQIIVHDNQVAFKINFELKLSGSLMFDREGNYLPEDEDLKNAALEDLQEDGVQDAPEPDTELSEEDIDGILQESRDFWNQNEAPAAQE